MKQTNATPTTKTNLPAAAKPADDDDPVPANIDEFRTELARRINKFIGDRKKYWRGCKERSCRRHRACAAPRIHCSNAPPSRPSTPQQHARFMAQLQRTLREVQAQREAGE
jgi:hypothetical protein